MIVACYDKHNLKCFVMRDAIMRWRDNCHVNRDSCTIKRDAIIV